MTSSNNSAGLTVAIVVYQLDKPVLSNTLESLRVAAIACLDTKLLRSVSLILVDNAGPGSSEQLLLTLADDFAHGDRRFDARIISGHGNIGYGRGHNLALKSVAESTCASEDKSDAYKSAAYNADDYHLILNPDVVLQADTLAEGLTWLQSHPDTIAVAPAISDGNGHTTSACKRYPSLLDFLLRGFAPSGIKQHFSQRLAHYEMQDLPNDRPSPDIPIISGCFMLFRQSALQQLHGFDPRYFLYFEDFDLSLRAHSLGSLTYLPSMRITHLGGNSARKGLRHIVMFARSALRFFSTHGWRLT